MVKPDAISSSAAVKSEPTDDPISQYEEEEDPIIRTIDVYISPTLSSTLHLLQFPIQPASSNTKSNTRNEPIDAKFRPVHKMLELQYAIPHGAKGVSDRPLADTMCLSSRTFSSSHIAPVTHMALAKLDKTGSRLDVVPIMKDVLQMRPSFDHLHLHDDEEEESPNNNNATESTGRKSLALQKKDQERSAQRHRNSYAYKRASEEGEDWISLDVHGNTRDGRWTGVKKEIMERVKCTHRERELSLSCTMKSNEGYVRSLNYLDSGAISFGVEEDLSEWAPSEYNAREPDKDDASVSSAVGPLERAAAELAAKLAVLLQNGNGTMIPYAVIRSRLNAAVSDEVLTMALSSCAVLVRGNFCLKSSLAQFLNVGGSGNNRGRDMRELRDLILLLLNMYGMVQRERLVRVYARDEEDAIINPESITFLLQTVAKRSDGNNCWVAKVQDDDTFAANFPEVAAFHGVYWVKKKERLKKLVVAYESATDE